MKLYHGRGPDRPSPKRIFLATPSYTGVTGAYSVALFNALHALEKAGIGCEIAVYSGNCHVDDGRNELVREFLRGDCTDLVFLDADLWFSGKALVELVQYDRDVVAGIYPKKQDEEEFPVWLKGGELWTDRDGLLEVEAVPTGFLRISRNAIKALAKTVPYYTPRNPGSEKDRTPLIFERSLKDTTRVGGDYEFCRKWRKLGGKIYVAPEMEFSHIGESEWNGSLASFLMRKNGLTDQYIKTMLTRISAGKTIDFIALRREWGNVYSAWPEYLNALYLMAQEASGPVLECGSGLTTLVLGASTQQAIYVLEDDFEYAQKIQAWVAEMGWSHVHIYHCPITDYDGFQWYEVPEDLPEFGFVVCDGPKRTIGRFGLVPVLKSKLADGCKILMDDMETMRPTVDRWGYPYNILGKNEQFAVIEATHDSQAVNQ